MRSALVYIFGCLISFSLFGQSSSQAKLEVLSAFDHFKPDRPVSADVFFEDYKPEMALSHDDEMKIVQEIDGHRGFRHLKYSQLYKGIPVLGMRYILHEQGGVVKSANGAYLPDIRMDITPTISPDEALASAQRDMNAVVYSWDADMYQAFPKLGQKPPAVLHIVDLAYPHQSGEYALAYVIEMMSHIPYDHQQYIIHAQTGQIINTIPLLKEHAVPATGDCRYYGTQSIIVDSIGPGHYELKDPTRGLGIITLDGDRELWTHEDRHWDLTNHQRDEVAIDAHYCASRFYDMMLEKFNWNGIDNKGMAMTSIVHGGAYVNASWNGLFATFGDGGCHHGPLTTLEVVAHEFMHGITDYTSDLIYAGESGAINESMSDVFGKALEYFEDPDRFTWLLGQSFIESSYEESFRSFENPNERGHPKYYGGLNWGPNGGVHTNSSIGNHWFYALVTGGMLTNERDETYQIKSVSMDDAIQIVFRTQSAYLTPTSNYLDYRLSSIEAAVELFGAGSDIVQSVSQAWDYVGVTGDEPSDIFGLDMAFTERRVQLCQFEGPYDAEVIVRNTGTIDYEPFMGGSIGYENEVLSLDVVIKAGESATISLPRALVFDDSNMGSSFILARLEVDDYDFFEYAFQDVINPEHEQLDVDISRAFITPTCQQSMYDLGFYIYNRSCLAIPSGTRIDVVVTDADNSFQWTEQLVLEEDLESFRFIQFNQSTSIDIPDQVVPVLRLDLPDDPDLTNNDHSFFSFVKAATATVDYSNDFDDLEPVFRYLGADDVHIEEHHGENYLVTSGEFSNSNSIPCPDPGAFLASSLTVQEFEMCVNTSDVEQSQLTFNLIQYRNTESNPYPELHDHTAVLRINWISDDGDEGNHIIYGQSEGQEVGHTIDLPRRFQGRILFSFYNHTGRSVWSFPDMLTYDAQLLDKLAISDRIVGTEDILDDAFLNLMPNPAQNVIDITWTKNHSATYKVVDLHGRLISTGPIQYRQTLDLSEWPGGYYVFIVQDGQQFARKPFVISR